jgi:hypothetical protein
MLYLFLKLDGRLSPFTSFVEIPIFPVEKYGLAEKFLDTDELFPKVLWLKEYLLLEEILAEICTCPKIFLRQKKIGRKSNAT